MIKYPYYHLEGCGKIAFYWIGKKPKSDDIMCASNIELLDGTHPNPGDMIICNVCKMQMTNLSINNFGEGEEKK